MVVNSWPVKLRLDEILILKVNAEDDGHAALLPARREPDEQ